MTSYQPQARQTNKHTFSDRHAHAHTLWDNMPPHISYTARPVTVGARGKGNRRWEQMRDRVEAWRTSEESWRIKKENAKGDEKRKEVTEKRKTKTEEDKEESDSNSLWR